MKNGHSIKIISGKKDNPVNKLKSLFRNDFILNTSLTSPNNLPNSNNSSLNKFKDINYLNPAFMNTSNFKKTIDSSIVKSSEPPSSYIKIKHPTYMNTSNFKKTNDSSIVKSSKPPSSYIKIKHIGN